MTPTFTYRAKVVKIVDGDTMYLDVDLGFRIWHRICVRLLGINTPEGADGAAATDALKQRLPIGESVSVTTFQNPGDKYGRWLAVVDHNGEMIHEWLLNENLATPMQQ